MDQKICTIFRRSSPSFHSIEEVFSTVIPEVEKRLPVTRIELPFPSGFWGVLRNLCTFRKEKNTIYHITGQEYYMALRTGHHTVLTIHDVGSAFSGNPMRNLLIRIFWFWLPALIARRITVISEFSKGELVRLVPFAANKIRVIHNPLNPALEYQPKPFYTERPSILLIGTKSNKNLERILPALKDIRCHLIIVGKLSNDQLTFLNKHGFVSESDPLLPTPLPARLRHSGGRHPGGPEGIEFSVVPELKSPLEPVPVNQEDLGVNSAIHNPNSAIPDNSVDPSSTITGYRLPNIEPAKSRLFVRTDHRLPETEYKIPDTEYRASKPNADPDLSEPTTDNRVPVTDNQVPKTDNRVPTTEYRPPSTDHRIPNTFSNYHNLYYGEILALYRECDLLCFASTYEGFGLPILEAQATGRPVITSNVASMPEVAGEGACLVDPFSVESIREGVQRVIHDPLYREALVCSGLQNIERFKPGTIAANYLKVYREVIAERPFDDG